MEQVYSKRLILMSVCFTGGMFLLISLAQSHAISLLQLRLWFAFLVLGLIAGIVWLKRTAKEPGLQMQRMDISDAQRKRLVRRLEVYVVCLVLLLIFGLWETRSGPLAPRLVGTAINLIFTFRYLSMIRRLKVKG